MYKKKNNNLFLDIPFSVTLHYLEDQYLSHSKDSCESLNVVISPEIVVSGKINNDEIYKIFRIRYARIKCSA